MQRRQPRPVFWPARLLWLPLVAAGLALLVDVDVDRVREGTWRVLVSIPGPKTWVAQPAFWPGLLLLAGGWIACSMQGARRLRVAAYGRLAAAAWVFLAVAVLSAWRFEGFVAQVQHGVDWRFLAHLRTTWLDRAVLGVSLAAGIACWILSWGPWPEARDRQQHASDEQDPPSPVA